MKDPPSKVFAGKGCNMLDLSVPDLAALELLAAGSNSQ